MFASSEQQKTWGSPGGRRIHVKERSKRGVASLEGHRWVVMATAQRGTEYAQGRGGVRGLLA